MAALAEDHVDIAVFREIKLIESLTRSSISRSLPVGLNYPQYEVLTFLLRHGDGVTPMAICQTLKTTKSGLTHTLKRLHARKLIRVEDCDQDGRRKRIWLTPEGRDVYNQMQAAVRPKLDGLRGGFTAKEFRDALPFLKALRTWLAEN